LAIYNFKQLDYLLTAYGMADSIDESLLYYSYIYDIYEELEEFHCYLCTLHSVFKFRVPYWFKTTGFVKVGRFRYGRSVYTQYNFVKRARTYYRTYAYFSNSFFKKTKEQNYKLSNYWPSRYYDIINPTYVDLTEDLLTVDRDDENFNIYLNCAQVESTASLFYEDQLFFNEFDDEAVFIEWSPTTIDFESEFSFSSMYWIHTYLEHDDKDEYPNDGGDVSSNSLLYHFFYF